MAVTLADPSGAFGFAPPPVQPDPTPAPTPAPAAGQAQPYQPSVWDIVQGVLFNGQSPAEAAQAARARNFQAQQSAMMLDALKSAPPEERLAMMLNPAKLGEAIAGRQALTTLKGGDTAINLPGGMAFTAPILGFDDKSGQGYSVGAGGVTATGGAQLPGDFSAKDGIVSSGRTGQIANRYALPEIVPAGSSLNAFTPGAGAGQSAPAGGVTTPASGAASVPPGTVPNNNFGNVKALPNGQKWQGQIGTDPSGFAIFDTPQNGARASLTNLQTYLKNGVNTPMAIAAKWAPAGDGKNDPVAYGHYLAGKLGIGPNDPIDPKDATAVQTTLRGIFDMEQGAKAMAAYRAPKAAASGPSGRQGGDGTVIQTVAPGRQPSLLSPDDPRMARFPKGTVVEAAPDGRLSVIQQPEYSPAERSKIRQQFLESDAYKGNEAASSALQALTANIGKMTGPSAYSILDTFARTINPGAVARQGTLAAIEESLGLPAKLVGGLQNIVGAGKIPLQTQQEILDAVTPFAQAHWDQAKHFFDANSALAAAKGYDASEFTAPIGQRPERMIAAPGGAMTEAAVLQQARAAIAKGADRNAVIQRLQAARIDPGAL